MNKHKQTQSYTKSEIEYIRNHYAKKGPTKIGEALGKSKDSVYHQAKKIGCRFGGGKEKDTEFIRQNITTLGTTVTAERLGRSTDYVCRITKSLGLTAAKQRDIADPVGQRHELEKLAISQRWV